VWEHPGAGKISGINRINKPISNVCLYVKSEMMQEP
jgi:hypothetical protein